MGLPASAETLCCTRVRFFDSVEDISCFTTRRSSQLNCWNDSSAERVLDALSKSCPWQFHRHFSGWAVRLLSLKGVLQDTPLAYPQLLALPDVRESERQQTSPNDRKGSCPLFLFLMALWSMSMAWRIARSRWRLVLHCSERDSKFLSVIRQIAVLSNYRWCLKTCTVDLNEQYADRCRLRRKLRSSDGDCSPLHSASFRICPWTEMRGGFLGGFRIRGSLRTKPLS